MLSVHGREPASVVVEPIARVALRLGLTPNWVTVISAAALTTVIVSLIPQGELVWAAVLVALFAALDMVDGTMARLSGGGTAFGATLDASCDRLTDGALFCAIVFWLAYVDHASPSVIAATLAVLVLSEVTSYIKARGEAMGLSIVGGLVERPERIIIAVVGLFLEGTWLPGALAWAMWILVVGSAITVVQRFALAAGDDSAKQRVAPPAEVKQ